MVLAFLHKTQGNRSSWSRIFPDLYSVKSKRVEHFSQLQLEYYQFVRMYFFFSLCVRKQSVCQNGNKPVVSGSNTIQDLFLDKQSHDFLTHTSCHTLQIQN